MISFDTKVKNYNPNKNTLHFTRVEGTKMVGIDYLLFYF